MKNYSQTSLPNVKNTLAAEPHWSIPVLFSANIPPVHTLDHTIFCENVIDSANVGNHNKYGCEVGHC
jgi:hypothetical protein